MLVELEHQAYWVIKWLNLDPEHAERKRFEQLEELDEFWLQACENAKLYKERIKKWHDRHIIKQNFKLHQQVLLFNSRLKLFPGNLRSKWSGPYVAVAVTPHGAVQLKDETSNQTYLVNGQRVKHYYSEDMN